MGYLTTVILHNDALRTFEDNPTEFAQAIFKGIDQAQYGHREVSCSCGNYANYIHVHPSRHADDETLYLHWGNSVTNLGAYDLDFVDLCRDRPAIAEQLIERAEILLKQSKKVYNELNKRKVNAKK